MTEPYQFGRFTLNFDTQSISLDGEVRGLKEFQFKLLKVFADSENTLIERRELFEKVFEETNYDERKLNKLIFEVRKTLVPFGYQHIVTRPNVGVIFVPELESKHSDSLLNDTESFKKDSKDFEDFWGKSVSDRPIKLVFAFRAVNEKHNKYFETEGDCLKTINGFTPDLVDGKAPLVEGIDYFLPMPDVRGAIYVSNAISLHTKQGFNFVEDRAISDDENCIVSFGLGWNLLTHKAQKLFDLKEKFFEVDWDNSPKKIDDFPTDNFKIGGISPKIEDGFDVALIARIVRRSDLSGRHRTRFLVCGRSASGTAAGGYFLANHWKTKLLPLYEVQYAEHKLDLNLDSMVVGIRHRISEELWQDFDESGEIIEEDGKKFVAFARVIGIE